jgi:hypothetical protein
MTAPLKPTELSLEETIDYLLRAKDSLETCLSYECQKKEYAIASLLLHVMHCIESALRCFDIEYYKKTQAIQKAQAASRKLLERG